MPKFSVIIPVFNRPALVREAIDSVLSQTYRDFEVIAVDDASTDETPLVLKNYVPAIHVITLPTQSGCEVARNAGAAAAHGDYLVFLDSDDLLFSWALETYDLAITATRQPALLVSRLACFAQGPPTPAAGGPGDTVDIVVFKDYLSRDRTVIPSFSMIVVRRDLVASVNGFRQSTATTFNASDQDFLLRVGCHGPAVLIENPRTIAYRVHAGNSVRNIRRMCEGMQRLVDAERRGCYPGGRQRQLDRRAVIGKEVFWWSQHALLQGQPGPALKLFAAGFDMVLAKVMQRLRNPRRGSMPITRLSRRDPHPNTAAD